MTPCGTSSFLAANHNIPLLGMRTHPFKHTQNIQFPLCHYNSVMLYCRLQKLRKLQLLHSTLNHQKQKVLSITK